MEDSTLVRKVRMSCPLCEKEHEVEERKRMTTITIKGKEVVYEERFYFCANADEDENEFENGAMTNENLLNARNAYQIKMRSSALDEDSTEESIIQLPKEVLEKIAEMTVNIEDLPLDDPWILDDGWDDIYERMDEYGEEGSN